MNIIAIEEMLEKEADAIYRNLKSKCKTYGELKTEINERLKQEKWSGSDVGQIILEKVEKKYEEDISKIEALPIGGSEN